MCTLVHLFVSVYSSVCVFNQLQGYRVDVLPAEMVRKGELKHKNFLKTIDLHANSHQINIKNLHENTDYFVIVTSITREYFESLSKNGGKVERVLPVDKPAPKNKWLPRSCLVCSTSGGAVACDSLFCVLLSKA